MTLTLDIPTAFGPGDAPRPHTPLWAVFDPDWYRVRYRQSVIEMTGGLPDDRGLYEFWLRDGARYAHSPNRYFDEIWYRRAHYDVENGIRMGVFDSGFQHYCETGHRGRSCHWLFSESGYFSLNIDLTPSLVRQMGYTNGYDHYLSVGQVERRASTAYLVPDLLRADLLRNRLPYDPGIGEFSRFIMSNDATTLATSWYFDPEWYLDRYQDVAAQIASGEYASPLHHYLSNENPSAYCPNAFFDEAYYLATYHDVGEQVRARVLRNGYDHFVRFGLFEGRSPAEGVVLPPTPYPGAMPGWKAICDNAFISHVRADPQAVIVEPVEAPSLRQLATLQSLRAETLIPLLARYPLDFRYIGQPALTVVIAVPTLFADLIQTLVSLHEGNRDGMQVILLGGNHRDDAANIERYAYGIEVISETGMNAQAGLQFAAAQAAAPQILVIEPGVTLFPGALDAARSRLDRAGIIAVAPQSLGPDLVIAEAGLLVARDGSCTPQNSGKEAFAPEAGFVRACDGSSMGALLCDTRTLRQVAQLEEAVANLKGAPHIWASLALSLRQASPSGRILYDPDFVVRVPEREPVPDGLTGRETRVLRRVFADTLRGNLPGGPALAGAMHKPARWGSRILVLASRDSAGGIAQEMRMGALSRNMVQLGLQVTQFLIAESAQETGPRPCGLPDEVEYRVAPLEELSRLIEQRRRGFDQIWIMGGHTLNRVLDLFNDKAAFLPDEGFILDLRSLVVPVAGGRAAPADQMPYPATVEASGQALSEIIANAWFCQDVVVQNAQQADMLQKLGLRGLTVLGDDLSPRMGEDFEKRHALLIATGSLEPRYEHAFLKWFIRSVMSRLEGRLPDAASLILACNATPSSDLMMVTHYQNIAPLDRGMAPLPELAARCRVLIAPDEANGCVSLGRLVAGASGLPAVIGGEVAPSGAQSVGMDASRFAEAIITLYQDRETWQRLSYEAQAGASAMTDVYRDTLAALLGQSLVKEEMRD